MPREHDREWDPELIHKVDRYHLVENLEQCLQCGKCTGNCPVAAITPSYNPRAIINDVLSGSVTRLLDSEEIWRCLVRQLLPGLPGGYQLSPVDDAVALYGTGERIRAKVCDRYQQICLQSYGKGLDFCPWPKGY